MAKHPDLEAERAIDRLLAGPFTSETGQRAIRLVDAIQDHTVASRCYRKISAATEAALQAVGIDPQELSA